MATEVLEKTESVSQEEPAKVPTELKPPAVSTPPMSQKPHMVYAGVFLVAVLLIIGYLAWKDIQAHEIERARLEQQAIIEEEKLEAAKERKENLDKCLLNARASYEADWANACQLNAKRIEEGYSSCLNGPSGSDSFCRSIWHTADPGPDCSLPGVRADRVNQQYKEAKDECIKLNPVD